MLKSTTMHCPHCGDRMMVRTGRMVSRTCREFYLQCQNAGEGRCNFATVGYLELVRTIVPSHTPNPLIYIPLSPRKQAPPNTQQLELDVS